MKKKKEKEYSWIIRIMILTFILAILFSIVSDAVLKNVNMFVAFIVLLFIIAIGVFFDTIGIAVATATEAPLHAMASVQDKGAKKAIVLIKNASIVSNFCNDVIGDIAGIVSGAATAVIMGMMTELSLSATQLFIMGAALSGIAASLTVGGKAVGKSIALTNSLGIVYRVGQLLDTIERKFHITIFKG